MFEFYINKIKNIWIYKNTIDIKSVFVATAAIFFFRVFQVVVLVVRFVFQI